jgi:UDP-GlcNAc:undecaprenyl-phosphate GlcNAc-1-phosphate transferase
MLPAVLLPFKPFLAFIVSFCVCVIIIPWVIKLAIYKNWVVAPRADRWHKKPTALMGGIGIFISYSIALFIFNFEDLSLMIYAGCLGMYLIGFFDDLKEVKPVVKLLCQLLCSFALIYNGYYFGGGLLGWAGIPLTFIWVIGITNAINLLDNMDGLAAGISTIVAIITGVLGILNNEVNISIMAFAIAGSALGFLVYNFKPARIFMGDSGSLFLGFALSFLSIAVQKNNGSSTAVFVLLIPISLMAIPIMDITLVTIKRLIAGRRIDQGGRDHTSHRLVALGLSEKKAVLTLYLISAIWGLLCVLIYKVKVNNLFLCISLLAIFSTVFSVLLSNVRVYNDSEERLTYLRLKGRKTSSKFSLRFFMLHKKLIVGICTDILLIYGSFLVAANCMRIELDDNYIVLGLFICVKVSVFYFSNLYNRLVRYIAVIELSGYFAATSLATIILGGILFFKGKIDEYPLYFLMVDFLLTLTGMLLSRFAYRWLKEIIDKSRQCQKKVIIYGAGDRGYLLVKELLQNQNYELKPIGWIDDDQSKHNMYLYGFKVHGGSDRLVEICKATGAEVVLISANSIDPDRENYLRMILADENIELGRFAMDICFNSVAPMRYVVS